MNLSLIPEEFQDFFKVRFKKQLVAKKPIIKNIMRIGILTISILIISVQMLVAVPVKGQSIKDVKIRIGLNNETLIQAFKKIESQSPFHFMYRNEEVGNIRNLNLPSSKGSVEEFLKTILSGTDLNYRQVNDQILIMLAKNPSPDSPVRMQQPPDANIVTGKITNSDGVPMAGVSVTIKGTKTGTTTDASGNFSLTVPANGIVIFSYIGFFTQEIAVNNQTVINVRLQEEAKALNQAVVTALGIKREARSLGYATATVNMDQVTGQSTNVGNGLLGKVSGVSVSALATGPGGSSKIRIRGQSSFGGNNSPLIIVNGSPINNVPTKTQKGADGGDGLLSINELDIESMTVLKGAAAAALYGFRAKDGAIIITTKSGSKGSAVEYNANFRTEKALDFTDFQYDYGEGVEGVRQHTVAEAQSFGTWSFGEKMDGKPTIQFDGSMQPYSPYRNRVKIFYQPGNSFSNSLAFSGGSDKGSFRLSLVNTDANAIVQNSAFHDKIVNLGINYKLNSKLSVHGNLNYSNEYHHNPVKVSGSTGINETAYSAANSIPDVVLQKYVAADGTELHYSRFTSKTNPFWITNRQFENQKRDRLLGNASLRYDFNDDIYVQGQVSQDYFSQYYENNTPTGTATLGVAPVGYNGNYQQQTSTFRELNLNFLAGIKHSFGNFGVNISLGGNQMDQINTNSLTTATNFYVKGIYTIGNGQILSPSYAYSEKKVNSLYAAADFSYRTYLFLNLTARNDWFSTLNPNSNSYLYPSASTSFVFSDLWASRPSWLNYGKFRVAYAEVGGDTDPYQNALYYAINTSTLNGSALGSIASVVSPNTNLRPLAVKETEVGMELRTFNSRVNLDVSLYNKNTTNEILNVNISNASGYGQTKVNLGKLRNRGVEAQLTVIPVTGEFRWETGFNGAYNISRVISLANGQLSFDVGNAPATLGTLTHEVGKPLGSLRVYDYKRDTKGNIVVSSGLPLQGNKITVGSGIPKWTGSWTNTITWKGFRIFAQVDFKAGFKVISATNYNEMRFGLTKGTLLGREGGIVMNAVNTDGSKNTTSVSSYDYFTNFSDGLIGMPNVFSGAFVRWRTLSIGHDISRIARNTFIKSINASISCNNVLMIKKFLPNMDPEAMGETSDNNVGMESYALPTTRSFGINLNFKF